MSKLKDTKQAYDRIKSLLDQQLLNKGNAAQQIRDCQDAVNVAFYLLGWAQFEYLSRKEAEDRIEASARAKSIDGISWKYILENIRAFSVRKRLEVVFFGDKSTLDGLNKDYEVRNEAAHNYKKLPGEVRRHIWMA